VDREVGMRLALRRLSDGEGRFALLAVDQRPPLFQLVARARPGLDAGAAGREVSRLKALITQVLGPWATGVLLDPLYGGQALAHLPREAGLLLTLEDHRFRVDAQGYRLSRIIPRWGVEAALRAGGDGFKLLLWYRPDAPEEVRAHQLALARRVGRASRKWGRPFVLELLPYPLPDEEPLGLWEAWEGILRDFADPGLGVALYKLPYVPGLMERFSERLPAPWVLLSGGLGPEDFMKALEEALRAGARGFLAGRAFWLEALSAYPDLEAVEARLLAAREWMRRALDLLRAHVAPQTL